MGFTEQQRARMPQWAALMGDHSDVEPEPDAPITLPPPPTPAQGAAVHAKELRRALKIVKPACGGSAIQALSGVLVQIGGGQGTLTCDSMEGACQAPISASGKVETLVSHAALEAAVHDVDGPVTITAAGHETTVAFGSTTVTLRQLRREDFPAQNFVGGTLILTGGRQLAEAVCAAAVSASTDETRPVLCGVRLDGEHGAIVATDSFRMFMTAMPGRRHGWDGQVTADVRAIVRAVKEDAGSPHPPDALRLELQGERTLVVTRSDRVWRVPLIDGQFPDYLKLLPEKFEGHAVLDRKDAARAVAKILRVLPGAGAGEVPARLTFRSDRVDVLAQKPDVAEVLATLAADVAGASDEQFGLSPQYLLEGLRSCGTSDHLELRFISPLRPLMLVDGDDRYLIMPIRLNA